MGDRGPVLLVRARIPVQRKLQLQAADEDRGEALFGESLARAADEVASMLAAAGEGAFPDIRRLSRG